MLICCCSKEENPIVLRCQTKSQLNQWQKVYWLILRRNVRLHVWLTWPVQDSHWRIQAEDLPVSSCHHGKVWKMIQQGTPHFLCAEVSSVMEHWNKIPQNIVNKDQFTLLKLRLPTILKSMSCALCSPFPPWLAFNKNKILKNDPIVLTPQMAHSRWYDVIMSCNFISIKSRFLPLKFDLKNIW